jgi:hypothetical protein
MRFDGIYFVIACSMERKHWRGHVADDVTTVRLAETGDGRWIVVLQHPDGTFSGGVSSRREERTQEGTLTWLGVDSFAAAIAFLKRRAP